MEGRQYDEFQPELAWIDEPTSHTLTVKVGAFTREQLRLQRDGAAKNLKISGERRLVGNRWSRFKVDVPLPDNSNVQALRARFENGILYAIIPKLQVSRPQQPQPIPPLPSVEELPNKRKADAQGQPRDTAPKEEVKSQDDVPAGPEKPTATSNTKDEPKPQLTAKPREEETRAKEAKTLGKKAKTSLTTTVSQKKEESPPVAQPLLPKITAMAEEIQSERAQATVKKATEKETSDGGLLKDTKEEPPTENGTGQGGQEKEAAPVSKDDERQLLVNVVVSGLLVVVFGIYFIYKIWYGLGDD